MIFWGVGGGGVCLVLSSFFVPSPARRPLSEVDQLSRFDKGSWEASPGTGALAWSGGCPDGLFVQPRIPASPTPHIPGEWGGGDTGRRTLLSSREGWSARPLVLSHFENFFLIFLFVYLRGAEDRSHCLTRARQSLPLSQNPRSNF